MNVVQDAHLALATGEPHREAVDGNQGRRQYRTCRTTQAIIRYLPMRRLLPRVVALTAALLLAQPVAAAPPLIVAFGNSLTAGLGVAPGQSYPARLEQKLRAAGYPHRVIAAGVSGETTAGGLRRVDRVLHLKPQIVILELGANDGLRGLPLGEVRANLDQIIQRLKEAGCRVVLAGMRLPPNYGPRYTEGFTALYAELARKHKTALLPFFLEGVATRPDLMQPDGLHPTADGYRVIVESLWPTLLPLLEKAGR